MQLERHALFWTASALLFAYLVQLLAPVLLPFVIGPDARLFSSIRSVDIVSRAGLPRWASAILLSALSIFPDRAGPGVRRADPGAAGRGSDRIGAARDRAFQGVHRGRAPAIISAAAIRRPRARSGRRWIFSVVDAVACWLASRRASGIRVGGIQLRLGSSWSRRSYFFTRLKDWPKFIAKLDSWLPRDNADQIRALALEIDSRVSAFIRGQGAVCFILALYLCRGAERRRARIWTACRIVDRPRGVYSDLRLVARRDHGGRSGGRCNSGRDLRHPDHRRHHACRPGAGVRPF